MPAAQVEQFKSDMKRAGLGEAEMSYQLGREGVGESVAPPAPATVDVPGFPAGRAQDFKLPYTADENGNYPITDDKNMRAWLTIGGFPVGIGNFLAAEIHRAKQTTEGMSDAEKQMRRAHTLAVLERKWGDKETLDRIDLVHGFVAEIEEKRPGFAQLLTDSGAGGLPEITEILYQHVSRLRETKFGPDGTVTKREQAAEAKKKAGHASTLIFG
jgi:hypothetical protein